MSAQPVVWSESELEEVACANCGFGEHHRRCVRPDGLSVVECSRCGLAYLSPRPRQPYVSRLYGREYFLKQSGGVHAVGYADYVHGPARKVAIARLNLLEKLHPLNGARVLEIGCATGELLAEMRGRGARVTGLDVSSWAAETARHRYGVEVIAGTLQELGGSLPRFDVIVALEVIEHVEDPKRFLSRLSEHLVPGGMAMVSTPNYRCARRFGDRWAGFQRSFEHLYFFSDDVLNRMAAAAGLQEQVWYTAGFGLAAMASGSGRRARARRLIKTLPGAVRVWSKFRQIGRDIRHVRYGQGHCLVAMFRKQPDNTATGSNDTADGRDGC